MNGIFGYLRLDGAPLDTGKLELMRQAMQYWGVDGTDLWREGSVGFGCASCFCTPESTEPSLPFHDVRRGLVLTAGAFLDNREELLDELGIASAESRTLPDTLIVHRAYVRWGEECIHQLTGDWHFAVWDIRNRKLFLARDHHGNTGVCYTQGPGFFAFGSGKKSLLALPEVPGRPDFLKVAQVLTSWPGDGVATAWEGISRVPPAHCLTVADGKVSVRRYWYAENTPEIHLPREEDYLDAFLEQYDRAVRVRLRSVSPVGATLSGGLDSGSVSVLAARHLRERGERLRTFTAVPLVDTVPYTNQNRFGDESGFARATAAHAGNIDPTWIRSETFSPMAGIRRMLDTHDEPVHSAFNQYWVFDLIETARAVPVRVLLTGQGGNGTVSWSGGAVNLLPILRSRQRREIVSRFSDLRKRRGLSFIGGIRRFFLAPLVAPLRSWIQCSASAQQPPFLSYSAIHPRFAETLDLVRLMQEHGHDPRFSLYSASSPLRYRVVKPGRTVAGGLWGEKSGALGFEVRDPTQDKRLMEFCLGIPERFHFAMKTDRAVLRRAFEGLLPDEVRLNRRTGLQAADIVYRVRQTLPEVEDALRIVSAHPLCRVVLNLPEMKRVLDSIQAGTEITREKTLQSTTILLRGMGVGLFLARFES